MTQENNQPVRNAEAAETINHVPTFEEVYEMPYIQESLRALLMSNSVNYPSLATYEDDIRQEMLIFLSNALSRYNPEKSDIKTFCRMKLETGLIRARRLYRTNSQRGISHAVPLDRLLNAERETGCGVSSAIRKNIECYTNDPFGKQDRDEEFQQVISALPPTERKICELILDGGFPIHAYEQKICTQHYFYTVALPMLKSHFRKNIF